MNATPPSPNAAAPYVRALRYRWLTRFYDAVVAVTTRESVFRARLLACAGLQAGQNTLDLACGTGTMAVLVKGSHPAVEVVGLDGDPDVLDKARAKATRARLNIRFDLGVSWDAPYPDGHYDFVFSSLFFHHLYPGDKRRTLREVARILKPGGSLLVCDWGRPRNPLQWLTFSLVRLLDGFEVTRENAQGRLAQIIRESGFRRAEVLGSLNTLLGTLDFIEARRE